MSVVIPCFTDPYDSKSYFSTTFYLTKADTVCGLEYNEVVEENKGLKKEVLSLRKNLESFQDKFLGIEKYMKEIDTYKKERDENKKNLLELQQKNARLELSRKYKTSQECCFTKGFKGWNRFSHKCDEYVWDPIGAVGYSLTIGNIKKIFNSVKIKFQRSDLGGRAKTEVRIYKELGTVAWIKDITFIDRQDLDNILD